MLIGDIRVGNNSTIGAMSLINKDVPSDSLAYGIPMKLKSKT
jgi:serine O-acetyltransferase